MYFQPFVIHYNGLSFMNMIWIDFDRSQNNFRFLRSHQTHKYFNIYICIIFMTILCIIFLNRHQIGNIQKFCLQKRRNVQDLRHYYCKREVIKVFKWKLKWRYWHTFLSQFHIWGKYQIFEWIMSFWMKNFWNVTKETGRLQNGTRLMWNVLDQKKLANISQLDLMYGYFTARQKFVIIS